MRALRLVLTPRRLPVSISYSLIDEELSETNDNSEYQDE